MTPSMQLPPPPGSRPHQDESAAAAKGVAATRRATLLLTFLGILVLMLAALCFLTLTMDPQVLIDQFLASTPTAFREQLEHENLRVIIRVEWVIAGTIALFIALSMLLSVGPIRRGRRGVVIYAIVIVSLCALWCGLNVLMGVVMVLLGAFKAIAGVLLASCVLVGFVACLLALVGSYKAARFASQERKLSLQSLRYPPGYASGYGAQVVAATPHSTTLNY